MTYPSLLRSIEIAKEKAVLGGVFCVRKHVGGFSVESAMTALACGKETESIVIIFGPGMAVPGLAGLRDLGIRALCGLRPVAQRSDFPSSEGVTA